VSIAFPLREKLTPFGRVSDPTIPVTIQTQAGVRTYRFLLDTGADCAVAPRRLAQQVGLTWAARPPAQMVGVGQGGGATRVGPLMVQVGPWTFTMRCLFVEGPRAPFMLGRADFLDRLVLTIDPTQRRIVLTAGA
jgi:predicted aspartyl protease